MNCAPSMNQGMRLPSGPADVTLGSSRSESMRTSELGNQAIWVVTPARVLRQNHPVPSNFLRVWIVISGWQLARVRFCRCASRHTDGAEQFGLPTDCGRGREIYPFKALTSN